MPLLCVELSVAIAPVSLYISASGGAGGADGGDGGGGGANGGDGGGGENSGPSYSTYAVQQMFVPLSSKRILAGPAVVLTVTTSGSGNGEKPSFCRVLL